MTTTKIGYGSASATAVTCTLTSLASSAVVAFTGRQSILVDNSSNLYLDYLIRFRTKGTVTTSTGLAYIWIAAALEATSPVFADGATGADAAFTAPTLGTAMKLCGTLQLNTSTAVTSSPMSVAACFGGVVPQKFAVVIQNASGGALSSTPGDHIIDYVGILATNA